MYRYSYACYLISLVFKALTTSSGSGTIPPKRPKCSTGTLHGYKYDESKEVVIKCLIDGDELRLQIIDFGDGIEDIEMARTPHYTTRPDLERAGMGLIIMDSLSDGFCISSIVGMGTKLTIRKNLKSTEEVNNV